MSSPHLEITPALPVTFDTRTVVDDVVGVNTNDALNVADTDGIAADSWKFTADGVEVDKHCSRLSNFVRYNQCRLNLQRYSYSVNQCRLNLQRYNNSVTQCQLNKDITTMLANVDLIYKDITTVLIN